jgi:hypothetical protein
MRFIFSIIFLCVSITIMAQDGLVPLEYFTSLKTEMAMKDSVLNVHPEMKPFSYWTVQENAPVPDSVASYTEIPFKHTDDSYFRVSPRLNVGLFNQAGSQQNTGLTSLGGFGIGAGYKNKVYLNLDGVIGYTNPPTYLESINDSLNIVPGFGYFERSGSRPSGYDFAQWTGALAFKPSKQFELFLGRGRHFIGEGYRSMFLSDYTSNYNYLKADVNVWRIKYSVLYTQMDQAGNYPSKTYPIDKKYSTMHYLSLNVTKWWSVGAFEAVVWEAEDSVVNRSFDINYANPLIFFRPVEFSMGSSDNSLLGFSSTLRPFKGVTLYGQILLDEFLFGEWSAPFRSRLTGDSTLQTGYWANKQSYQLGVKLLEPLGINNASFVAEFNAVRPFTYGHSNATQSYTNANQPLAHPLGSNFIEWVQITTWQPGKFNFGLFTTYSRKGFTNNIAVMGDDVLISNTERDLGQREYGNFMMQGRRVDVANVRLNAGYELVSQWNLRLDATIHYRLERSALKTNEMVFFGLGLTTALWNDYRNL